MQANWTGTAALKLKIVPRAGTFATLEDVFAVGVLGSITDLVGNAVLLDSLVATGNTNTVIGLERAVVLESAAATGGAGTISA
jgi:hypothetical protein